MANQQKYTRALVLADGALLAEMSDVTITRNSGAQPVHTTAKGLAGFSPGSQETTISVSNGVPAADMELDPGAYMKFGKVITLTVQLDSGKSLKCKGQVMQDSFSHSVNSPASLKFEFHGGPSSWE